MSLKVHCEGTEKTNHGVGEHVCNICYQANICIWTQRIHALRIHKESLEVN